VTVPRTVGPAAGATYYDVLNQNYLRQVEVAVPVKFTCLGQDGQYHTITCTIPNGNVDETSGPNTTYVHDFQTMQFMLYHLIQDIMGKHGQPLALAPALKTTGEFVYAIPSLVDVKDYKTIPKP